MQLSAQFFRVAMKRLSLFRRSTAAKELLHSIADVTGIPVLTLLYAERRIASEASLKPLRELLNDQTATHVDRLKYKVGLTQTKGRRAPNQDQIASRFNLEVATERGTVKVELNILVQRAQLAVGERQQANISIKYRITNGMTERRYRQELVLSGTAPRLTARVVSEPLIAQAA